MRSEKPAVCEDADRDLLQLLTGLLRQRGFDSLRTLVLSVEGGVVAVQGPVPSYHLRQIAVECIRRVAGVTRVVDQIFVDRTI